MSTATLDAPKIKSRKPPLKKEGALLTSKHEDCQRHARSFVLALFAAVIGPGRNVRSVVHCKGRIRTSFMPSFPSSLPLKRSIQLVRKTPWPTDFLASHRRPPGRMLALHASADVALRSPAAREENVRGFFHRENCIL